MTRPFFNPHNQRTELFTSRIPNCYDSHVHWQATGEWSRRLRLHALKQPEDIMNLEASPENFQGEWLSGYGWDQNQFRDKKFPHRAVLDKKFGLTPVVFTRVDGHALWVSTEALKRAGLWQKNVKAPFGGRILLDDDGWPTGVLIDLAMNLVQCVLPQPSLDSIKKDLLAGQMAFHRAGFTHIRDLTCNELQWRAATALAREGQLRTYVEQFFSADNPEDFNARVALALEAKKEVSRAVADELRWLRPMGIKVYLDGALGSEGAWISRPYATATQENENFGLQLLPIERLKEMMKICFRNQLDLAVHAIGDEAAHQVAGCALQLKELGVRGRLHIEHAELLRPDTIDILKQINVVCHMQPCHWLSDKNWLEAKIGELISCAFRWADLEKAGVPFLFGSDSPIEPTSLQRNFQAICDAEKNGIPGLSLNVKHYHSHPDGGWSPNTYTDFENGRPIQICVGGQKSTHDQNPSRWVGA